MKLEKALKIFFLLAVFPAIVPAQKYVQVWGDEFNESGLPDSTKWDYEVGYKRNNELQYYTKERLKNARIEDSVLIIEAHKEYYQGANYTSASLISKGTGDWRYGKIEVSVKVPEGKGTWPAVWMMPTYSEYGGWPRSGEIDIMEYVGYEPHKLHHYIHFEGTDGTGHESSGTSYNFAQPYNQFVKFTLIWTPEKIEWYSNDVWRHTYFKNSDDYRRWPFNKEFYLILNLAYGGSWGGQQGVDDTKLPHKYMIDYVRVYQLQESEGPFALTVEPTEGGTVQIDPVMDAYPEGTEVTLTAIPDDGYSFTAWKHFSRANPFTLTVNKDTRIVAEFNDEKELIENGTFEISHTPWEFYVHNSQTAAYQASVQDSIFTVNVTKSPGTDWQLGFQQLRFPVRKGEYRLTFDAWADQQNQLLISISKNYPDWGELAGKRVTVTTSRDSYEVLLNVPRDDNNVRLYFGLGNFAGKFNIDNISLMRVEDTSTS
ncbi:MAG: family 16 glycosylhydrolase, partial [Mariniphaga sp.]